MYSLDFDLFFTVVNCVRFFSNENHNHLFHIINPSIVGPISGENKNKIYKFLNIYINSGLIIKYVSIGGMP